MGQCFSCGASGEVPSARDLGLPPNFKVLKELGAGGEARTYLLKEKSSDGSSEVYAVKVLPRGPAIDEDFLLRGIRNQCCLNHIHIVKLHEVILSPTHLLIKLEYAGGGELLDYLLKQRPVSRTQLLSEEHARFFFLQLVYALHHCHEHRVAHRDITFANVLLDGSRPPIMKVCDFGMSKGWESPEDCKSFTVVGTPLFMPPEMMKNHCGKKIKAYDPRKSDIWSLGIILFAMLLGRFPFVSRGLDGSVSEVQLSAGSSADFASLLKKMERAHQSNPRMLRSEIWGSASLSLDCKRLLDAMLIMDASERITLDGIIHHRWVCGPLLLEHARCIAACREEMERPMFDQVHLPINSAKFRELADLIHQAVNMHPQDKSLVRWMSPLSDIREESCPNLSEPSFSTPRAMHRKYRSVDIF